MEILLNSSMWIELITLIILEIVLGIDNIVFIAIITDKLIIEHRDKARFIGLTLALFMRLGLLLLISWLINLKKPLFNIGIYNFSSKNIILIIGGIFLIIKSTTELYKNIKNKKKIKKKIKNKNKNFWITVIQIIIIDIIFSIDTIITAVGIVNNLIIMISAIIISMPIILFTSKTLTFYINKYKKIMILCLIFLLIVGLNLVANGFNIKIPKKYLYIIISILLIIEFIDKKYIFKNKFKYILKLIINKINSLIKHNKK
ncbi:MAG: hypothetical protein G3R24_00920 [gamma proteobacterium endosymbiont of Trioza apicalis]